MEILVGKSTSKIGERTLIKNIETAPTYRIYDKAALLKNIGYIDDKLNFDVPTMPVCIIDNPKTQTKKFDKSLPLHDPSQTEWAINMLKGNLGLHEKIDILFYLYSCYDIRYEVPEVGPLRRLIDAIYEGALESEEWGLVRKAVGMLERTSAWVGHQMTFLLVQQKTLTIGLKPNEFVIQSPKSTLDLSNIIFNYW